MKVAKEAAGKEESRESCKLARLRTLEFLSFDKGFD